MSTPDRNSCFGSSVLCSPERTEITLSGVICTYNRYYLLPEAIESLTRQEAPANSFEIIVVDNSADQVGAARFGQRYAGLSNLIYLVEAGRDSPMPATKAGLQHLAESSSSLMMRHALARPGPKSFWTFMRYFTAGGVVGG